MCKNIELCNGQGFILRQEICKVMIQIWKENNVFVEVKIVVWRT